jgi:hypothetical protein
MQLQDDGGTRDMDVDYMGCSKGGRSGKGSSGTLPFKGQGKGQSQKPSTGQEQQSTPKGKGKAGKSSTADRAKTRLVGTCHYCGKVGHKAKECWQNPQRNVGYMDGSNQVSPAESGHHELPHQAASSSMQQADSSLMSMFGTVTCKLPRAGVQPWNGAQLGTKHVT